MSEQERVLATTVHYNGEVYLAGSVPPPEVAERITNPKAWAKPTEPAAAESTQDSEPPIVELRTETPSRRARRG